MSIEHHHTEPTQRSIEDGASACGSVNNVVRRGDSVIRPMGHWSLSVHELLLFLDKEGFDYSPRFQAIEQGAERLSYIHGEVALRPWPEVLCSLRGLKQVAEMLRQYHQVVKNFHPQLANWHLNDRELPPHTIIRHGDLGPWNMVWDDDQLVGLIDWDFAEPGTILEDVAQAAWQCIPLKPPARAQKTGVSPDDVRGRLEFFCEECGVTVKDVLREVCELQDLEIKRMTAIGADGIEPWASFLKRGDVDFVMEEKEWLDGVILDRCV